MARCFSFSARSASMAAVGAVITALLQSSISVVAVDSATTASTIKSSRAVRLVHDLYRKLARSLERDYSAGHGLLVPPVLPGRQGHGTAGRAVDHARRPGTCV